MNAIDPRQRFTDRADDYKRYRPGYPSEILDYLKQRCRPDSSNSIADVGSGTGISSQLLISGFNCLVYGIEPNAAMRREAESHFRTEPLFVSINGSAENTTLPDSGMDLVTVFQAFHWFDRDAVREEFRRILKEQKWVLIVWNSRLTDESEFLKDYEKLLQKLSDYRAVNHRKISREYIYDFFGNDRVEYTYFPNKQIFDLEGLRGRFFSSSYTPAYGTELYIEYDRELERLFNRCRENDCVEIRYRTETYLGEISG
jgi:SAM-dependent methyltransferase